jgi:predicted Zn finger-like uncharacterized protein
MTQMVTRCPKCATAFRITSTQLESAKGAVRCGSCLHIFKAQEYLVKGATPEAAAHTKAEPIKSEPAKPEPVKSVAAKSEQPKVEKPQVVQAPKPAPAIAKQAAPVAPVKPAAQPVAQPKPATPMEPVAAPVLPIVPAKPVIDKAKVLEDEEDVLISDDMDNATEKASTYEFDGFVDLDMHPKQTVSLFEREIRYEPTHDNDEEESADESWAENLLDDDGEPLHQLKKPIAPPPAPIVEPQSEPEPIQEAKTETITEQQPASTYSGPVFSFVSEDEEEIKKSDDGKEEPFFSEAFLNATRAPAEPVPESSAFAAALFEQEAGVDDNYESEKPSGKRPVKSSKMRAFDGSRAALLMNIIPAPVELTARRMRRWYQRKLWSNLVIIMSVLLFVQIAYFKFDYFSRVEPYRTAYLFVCPLLGCEVPSLVDTSQILATNLIVRNHPTIGSALMVDAILINNAPFEQPFPDLVLSFSKLDETPVASRRFTPKEYLAGELAGMRYIPQGQPVHITLEIADPGPDAVNYTLATHY